MSTYIVKRIPLVANTACKLNILIKQVTYANVVAKCQRDHIRPPFSRYNSQFWYKIIVVKLLKLRFGLLEGLVVNHLIIDASML